MEGILEKEIRDKIDNIIEKVLDLTKNKDSVPVNVFSICNQLGFSFARIRNDKTNEYKGILIVNKSNNVGKFSSRKIIGINPTLTEIQTRHVIAHELGHYFLHSDINSEQISFKVVHNEKENDFKEKEANYFAAALLVPTEDFKNRINNYENKNLTDDELIKKMSAFYCIEEECIKIRIEEVRQYLTKEELKNK